MDERRVSLHWDFVCDRLASERVRRLVYATAQALNAVNRPTALCVSA